MLRSITKRRMTLMILISSVLLSASQKKIPVTLKEA
jgi:hypothetical protein